MTTQVTASELRSLMTETSRFVLIDVRAEADYQAARIPGARHNCVFEIAFLDRMSEIAAPGDKRALCVYGNGETTHEARMAAEKLVRAGYSEVLEFRGGIEQWLAAGGAVEGQPASPSADPGVADGRRQIDLGESRLEWIGRNLLNRHHGTLVISGGHLDFRDGMPSGGEFTFDMHGISCTNLAGDPLHDVLVDHLRSDDFFETEVHPEARYRIVSARRIGDCGAGKPNLRVEGELTLKGKTLPLVFDAVAGFTPDGRPAAQAVLAFDRTLWNVIYGSARFFSNIGMHLVNDLIEVHLRIVVK
jgi:rhodanese-related sulfurtransferase/polyisoprenoid-binding protein YceI